MTKRFWLKLSKDKKNVALETMAEDENEAPWVGWHGRWQNRLGLAWVIVLIFLCSFWGRGIYATPEETLGATNIGDPEGTSHRYHKSKR